MAEVIAPDGARWRVERHWLPRWRDESPWTRLRRRLRSLGAGKDVALGGADLASVGDLGGPFAVIGLVILVVALLALVALVLVPLLLVLVDLVVVLLLAAGLVLARVLFRRPWTIEVIGPDEHSQEWKVVGLRESGRLRADLGRHIEAGLPLPPPVPAGGGPAGP